MMGVFQRVLPQMARDIKVGALPGSVRRLSRRHRAASRNKELQPSPWEAVSKLAESPFFEPIINDLCCAKVKNP
jgi:hypothetical protein